MIQKRVLSKKSRRRLFPMHLTPFEFFMLADDTPTHPKTFIVRMELSGRLDRDTLEASIADALPRHPLLQAWIRPGKQNRDCWVSAEGMLPRIDWGGIDDEITFENGEFIDIRNEVGLRIWIRCDDQNAVITTQFHHCTCDGIGSYQFLGDVLWAYQHRIAGTDPEFEDPEFVRLRMRGEAGFDLSQFRDSAGKVSSTWKEWMRVVGRPIARLKSLRPASVDQARHGTFPGIQTHRFSCDEYEQIRQAARSNQQSTNDLILEKLFKTLEQWNRKQRTFPSPGAVCVMMPLNLRAEEDNCIPAANVVSMAFLHNSPSVCRHGESLRKSLRQQVDAIKRDRHRLKFTQLLADAQQMYPRLMDLSLRLGGCMSTGVLSNTGDPTLAFRQPFERVDGVVRCGDLTIEDVAGVPPIRNLTRVTISIFNYRRILKVCMRCDPTTFTDADTRQLLEMFAQNLQESISSG